MASPQIQGQDGDLWQAMIEEAFPNWVSNPHRPDDPKDWHKVYSVCLSLRSWSPTH